MNPASDESPHTPRPDSPGPRPDGGAESLASALPCDQDRRWREGERVPVEEYLRCFPALAKLDTVVLDLIRNEFRLREDLGEEPRPEEYIARFPQYRGALELIFAVLTGPTGDFGSGLTTRSHKVPEAGADDSPPPPPAVAPTPSRIGRYPVLSVIDSGGFGVVYRGRDESLGREVAIKVPHPERTSAPEEVAAFLAEAQILARLDHRGIVPVYDFGRMEDGRCFLVSKLVPGGSLSDRMRAGRLSHAEAAGVVAAAAEALHHAHQNGLVHRDVKPANILLGADGRPVVADFGLALREEDYGRGPIAAGTPAYMSPEQARGEGHLVDARSDIYSLGVVFYELLTGRRPFQIRDRGQLRELVKRGDPRPPRQHDDSIPRELDRICLKAMAKRASDRYSTALDLAEDLRQWLVGQPATPTVSEAPRPAAPTSPPTAVDSPTPSPSARTEDVHEAIVPRGLRSFGPEDADFFLDLLPGPRGRGGLPESIRFWKTLLEEADADRTFRVGLIYGPSGSGKSSLLKAGLLPRLAEHVATVYVEATPDETEVAILKGLRKTRPDLPAALGLAEALAFLRRTSDGGSKIVIVIDQFEQWLHAYAGEAGERLIDALRQCDGGQVQALLLVRDDFWMGITRFMRELEVPLLEGRNSAPIDLFTPRHARKVLAAFGRAFGALPSGDPTPEQSRFLDQAVAGLTDGGKVIAVRLALFAEMVKGKPWTPATWHEAGGAEGIGVAFLEETFAAPTAPPHHRLHQRAARAVLARLLPEPGADLKGPMRSRAELLEVSGYAAQPAEFDDLLRVLDGELRLVTATEREGSAPAADSRAYQLTHDYLVPALREWLTRKQRETRRGRAELRLAERAAAWAARPENRHLPSWWEWVRIRLFTRRRDWTPWQSAMMRRATRVYVTRAAAVVACVILLACGAWEYHARSRVDGLRNRVLHGSLAEVPVVIGEMEPYQARLELLLRADLAAAPESGDPGRQLRVSLALLPWDRSQLDYLYDRLLSAQAEDFPIIRDQLGRYREELTEGLWKELDTQGDPDRRFRAACALASYSPKDRRWGATAGDVVAKLVAQNALVLNHWARALAPVGKQLLPALAGSLEDEKLDASQRRAAAAVFRDFASGDEAAFAPLVQFALTDVPDLLPTKKADTTRKIDRAKRRANVATALVAMGRGADVWRLLDHSPDPTVRSYLIERLVPGGASAQALEKIFDAAEAEPSIRLAVILAMGSLGEDRPALLDQRLRKVYDEDPDPGVHSAAEWVLRQWGREADVAAVTQRLASGKVEDNRRWLVNSMNQTFAVVTRDGRSMTQRIAVATREVRVAEYAQFCKDWPEPSPRAASGDPPECPARSVSWYRAAAFCNWLSWKDGIEEKQWCYERNAAGEYAEGMKIRSNYLSLAGYRLPTAAEWDFAASAGANTPWACGDVGRELLAHYGWFYPESGERSHPVGTLKPNDLGLFDVIGNTHEWCHDAPRPFVGPPERLEPVELVEGLLDRVVRGGAFTDTPATLGLKFGYRPGRQDPTLGLRPVRTLP